MTDDTAQPPIPGDDQPDQHQPRHERAEERDYGADQIKILEGLEAVRKRPGMYVPNTASEGLHHLVFEVVDNSVDEAMAYRCDSISVTILPGDEIRVTDNGSGIPVGMHKKAGTSALEVIMTTLHAGGKFDGQAYKVSGGLHGVGVSVVNALSEWLKVTVHRDGRVHRMEFRRGDRSSPIAAGEVTDRTGTVIHFKPDPEMFSELEFHFDTLAQRLRELAFLTPGLHIRLVDERTGREHELDFQYDGGIAAFVRHLNLNRALVNPEPIHLRGCESPFEVDVAIQYNDTYTETVYSFVNAINTYEGGTHLSAFRSVLTRTMNDYAQSAGLLKDSDVPSGEDWREGLVAVVSVRMPEPQFGGQSKRNLGSREIQKPVQQIVAEGLRTYLEEHPAIGKAMVQKALLAMRARDAARKSRELVRRKTALSSGGLPGKLAECSSRDREETEVFLVEGDSAGGSAKQGRDRRTQAILPLRGKILNVEKARIDKMLKHQEIQTIIQALGTGIGVESFNPDALRYGKIIIMTDADVDGSHIRTLLLTFFFRHMAELIRRGRVYVAQPPLYRIKTGKRVRYVHSDGEMRTWLMRVALDRAELRRIGADGSPDEAVDAVMRGDELRELVDVVELLHDIEARLLRRGVHLKDYTGSCDHDGRYPLYRVTPRQNEARWIYTEDAYDRFIAEQDALLPRDPEPVAAAEGIAMEAVAPRELLVHIEGDDSLVSEEPDVSVVEFRWRPSFVSALERLANLGYGIDELHATSDEAAFCITAGKDENRVADLRGVVGALLRIGESGIEGQKTRFKGLGEMNPEELRETTMDRDVRTLLRVRLEDAVAADRMFTVLMGEQVEPRRRFIQTHALDVADLDV